MHYQSKGHPENELKIGENKNEQSDLENLRERNSKFGVKKPNIFKVNMTIHYEHLGRK